MPLMPSIDEELARIAGSTTAGTIADVIHVMQALDAALPDDDGLKWFNYLYLRVTEDVAKNPRGIVWENPHWLVRLDVVFANLYFAAIMNWQTDRSKVARSWSALFEARHRSGTLRLQFALAGMNAHINHDLPIAVVQTGKELRNAPRRGTPEHRDFQRVDDILETVQEQVRHQLMTGLVGVIDRELGRTDDMIVNWKVRKARDTAWSNAEILWRLNRLPAVRKEFLTSLDRLVSLAGRGLLAPVTGRHQAQDRLVV